MKANRLTLGVTLALAATMVVRIGSIEPASAAPADRYDMAGGCWAVKSVEFDRYVKRSDNDGFIATATTSAEAEPFYFKATDLGSYLLYGTKKDYFAAGKGVVAEVLDTATQNTAGGLAEGLSGGATTTVADTVKTAPVTTGLGRFSPPTAAATASDVADFTIDDFETDYTMTINTAPGPVRLRASAGGGLSFTTQPSVDPEDLFTFDRVTGCTPFPEIEVNIEGPVPKGASPTGEVRGYVDAHNHMMAFEFLGGRVRCGKPWHRFGVEHALVDCPDHEPQGAGAVLEQILSGGPGLHDTAGWPTFPYWPKSNSLTHEQIYYKWLERAYRGGLRLMVNLLVDNAALCNVYPYRKNSCNEMDGVRLQAQRIREIERYIDAQEGGPGEGWFRIVTDPAAAREVINAGKLAVVLGIEVSTPLDCGLALDLPVCDEAKIDRQLDEVYALGVRQMELTNKFDNGLTGVTGDAGTTGVVVNSGNFQQTGQFWKMDTCEDPESDAHDHLQLNLHDNAGTPPELTGRDSIFAGVLAIAGTSGAAPAYPPGPHCNVRGLSDLGAYALRGMISRGMIFDPDHMSALARTQALDLIEDEGYSGVVSSHSWADDTIYPRIIAAGGMVTPHAGSAASWLTKWRKTKAWADPRYFFGIGFGSDVNGFSNQGPPRGANAPNRVEYPFTGFGGVTVHQQRSGERLYNVNTDGVAHYGLYPDWIEDIRRQLEADGPAFMEDMARGAEAYIQMWERATGVR